LTQLAGLRIPIGAGCCHCGDRSKPVPLPIRHGYAFPNGTATNLMPLFDFTRISTVCLPALCRSAISLLTSAGLDAGLPAVAAIIPPAEAAAYPGRGCRGMGLRR